MVEFFLVETHNLEILPMMVTVTGNTGLSADISRRMIAFFFMDKGFQFSVTIQTFRVGDFVAQFMAFCAIRHPLKPGMQ